MKIEGGGGHAEVAGSRGALVEPLDHEAHSGSFGDGLEGAAQGPKQNARPIALRIRDLTTPLLQKLRAPRAGKRSPSKS